ncbi:MAG: hypothetical protein LBG06_06520 [Deltaproteobacteria bacterium]|jgi:hypothetical protein|nr:hypothetical protein [Deltaproteobacteria bacterium]
MRSCSRSSGRAGAGPAATLLSALALAAILALPGCARTAGVPPDRAPAENLRAEGLARAVWAEGEDLRTFAVRGDANYLSGNGRRFFRFELVCERPGSLLFTARDPFGQPAFRLAVADGYLRAADYLGRAYYAGEARGGALELLLPLPLEAEGLLAALSGSLPFEPGRAEALAPLPTGEGEALFLAYPAAGGGAPLRVSVSGAAPWDSASWKTLRSVSRGSARDPDFQARYGRWEPAPRDDRGGALRLFPRTVAASWRHGGGTHGLELSYREVSLGFTPPESVFVLERPEGFSLQPI